MSGGMLLRRHKFTFRYGWRFDGVGGILKHQKQDKLFLAINIPISSSIISGYFKQTFKKLILFLLYDRTANTDKLQLPCLNISHQSSMRV
jgi:hypothetical protein